MRYPVLALDILMPELHGLHLANVDKLACPVRLTKMAALSLLLNTAGLLFLTHA